MQLRANVLCSTLVALLRLRTLPTLHSRTIVYLVVQPSKSHMTGVEGFEEEKNDNVLLGFLFMGEVNRVIRQLHGDVTVCVMFFMLSFILPVLHVPFS